MPIINGTYVPDDQLTIPNFDGSTLENIGTGFSIGADALGAFGALQNARTARGQLDLAREEYQTNLQNQGALTNAQLSDRQGRRVADNPNATPVSQYLAQYGAKDAQGKLIGG